MPPVDPLTAALERAADAAAAVVAAAGPSVAREAVAARTCAGLVVEVRVRPAARRGPPSRADTLAARIVEVVTAAGRRLDTKEVRRALRARGWEHGDSTVEKALGRLTAAGRLWNDHSGEGYGLAEWARRRPDPQPSLFPDPDVYDEQLGNRRQVEAA